MIRLLQKNLPVGINAQYVKKSAAASFVFSVLLSVFLYCSKFFSALNGLYHYESPGIKILDTTEMMPDFRILRVKCFDVFFIMLVLCIAFAVYNFAYHYIGSKSIYTMLRLRSRKEFIIRCISVPLVFAAVLIITIIILNFIYYFTYILLVPAECLYVDWKMMWRF